MIRRSVSFLPDFSLNCLFFCIAYIKKSNEFVWILPILAPVELTMYLRLLQKYSIAAFIKNIWKARNPGNEDGSYDFSFDCPRLIEPSTKKTGFFWVPNILREVKDLSNNRRKPFEQDRFVDEQTGMKWKYGWHVWSYL